MEGHARNDLTFFDSGHGNIGGMGLEHLDSVKERLISLHLHDNNGFDDQHNPIFSGTINWGKLARIVSGSKYNKFLTFEIDMKFTGIQDEKLFLKQAHSDGLKLLKMI